MAFVTSLYLAPQRREYAFKFYDFAARLLGVRDPAREIPMLPDPRFTALAFALATEFGDDTARERLGAFADKNLEPTWNDAEFTWGFGLKEPHPRGQMNATMMVGETGREGAWSRIFNEPNLRKFEQPTVAGIDFPKLGISEAMYDEATRTLHVTTDVGDPGAAGQADGVPD